MGIDNETVRTHAATVAEESGSNPLILFELASYYDPEAADSRIAWVKSYSGMADWE